MKEVTIGIAGAAGDGLDKTGDTLAKSAGRQGLHVYAYNSYQSIIRGGHIDLRVRIAEQKVYTHGDNLTALIALNQDSLERHAQEVDEGGVVVFNSDRLKWEPSMLREGVQLLPLPMSQVTAEVAKEHGPVQPIMQNTVALGAVLSFTGLGIQEASKVLNDTFQHKGQKIVDLNIGLLKAGFDYASQNCKISKYTWKGDGKRRPFVTGNEILAIGAVAAGCKFYSAYPMTPASGVLHWMANHAEKVGVVVKQCEDELSVINMAIGAGVAGVRSACATSGGGFALMTEAIGMAGIMEIPVVCIEVQRGGPSTGLPTKTEQADLNQVYGASQGDFPRLILAPYDIVDAYYSITESFNLADKYQMPVLLVSDLLLSEHPETIDADALTPQVKIDRGELVKQYPENNGRYKRYALTPSGVSPRALPGTPNTLYVSATDDHDEESILISDMFTSPPVRRKMQEKRQRKMEGLLKELPAPKLEGPADADVTLVGWGSTYGVIRETAHKLTEQGIKTNYLIIKYILPFHTDEVTKILTSAKKKISVEVNYTSQMASHIKRETGISMDAHINRYDGEPMQPAQVVMQVKELLSGKKPLLSVTESEAREIAYHYLRTHYGEKLRPGKLSQSKSNGKEEPVWRIELVERATGNKQAEMEIGVETGATYFYKSLVPQA